LDKKDKLPKDAFETEAKELLGGAYTQFESFVKAKKLEEIEAITGKTEGYAELQKLLEILDRDGIMNVIFDPTLVRGFDYYTGTVFEIFDTDKKNPRALFGGGRYDNLTEMFDVEKVSGVGFGMGDVTIRDYLETRELLPEFISKTKIYICTIGEKSIAYAHMIADMLRLQGVHTAVDFSGRKIPAQIKTAEKHKIPYIICMGEEEIGKKTLTIKNLATHEEKEIEIGELSKHIELHENI
jgi:histidyl-tRNA synthetase